MEEENKNNDLPGEEILENPNNIEEESKRSSERNNDQNIDIELSN